MEQSFNALRAYRAIVLILPLFNRSIQHKRILTLNKRADNGPILLHRRSSIAVLAHLM